MDSEKSTALFEISHLTAEHGGLWECRVSTKGGQDFCKFNLTVKGETCLHEFLVIKQLIILFHLGEDQC